jgi:uncharacterized protein (DUF1330 family)
MPAYIIADIVVKDTATNEIYTAQTPDMVEKYGGKFIVRGGEFEALEGGWSPSRLVVVEFPSFEQARKFYYSDEYKPLRDIRLKTTESKAILVDGA